MTTSSRSARLRFVLRVDALASGASGLLLLAGGQLLAAFVGIPTAVLLPLGVLLIVYAAALWFTETRPTLSASAVQAIIAANCLWVVASILAVILGWLPLTAPGIAVALAQAAAVALLAELEFTYLRQATPRVPASA
jgi:hypothetical protein